MPILRSTHGRNAEPCPGTLLPPNEKSTNTTWSNTLSRRRPDICSVCHQGRHSPLACPTINPVEGVPSGYDTPDPCGCHLISRTVTEEPGGVTTTVLKHFKCVLHRSPEPPIDLEDLPLPPDSLLISLLDDTYSLINLGDLPTPPFASTPEPVPAPVASPVAVPQPPTRKRKHKSDTEKSITQIVTKYNAVLATVTSGDSLLTALQKNDLKYGSHWLNYRRIAELYIVDRAAFDNIWNPYTTIRQSAAICKTILSEKEPAVRAAKEGGCLLK